MIEDFLRVLGRPDPARAAELDFGDSPAGKIWQEVHPQIGAGYFLDGFLYLFGEGLAELAPCLQAWDFLVPPNPDRTIIGKNAHGALLVLEDGSSGAYDGQVHVLDPTTVEYWTRPALTLGALITDWLPQKRLGSFMDDSFYLQWKELSGESLDLNEILAMTTPLSLGGKMVASNFGLEDIVKYYRSTAPIYRKALSGDE